MKNLSVVNGGFSPSVPQPPDRDLNHDAKVLTVHREVDEEVSGTSERQQEVTQIGNVRNPLWPGHRLGAVILVIIKIRLLNSNTFKSDRLVVVFQMFTASLIRIDLLLLKRRLLTKIYFN
jgi:hypothetical protein